MSEVSSSLSAHGMRALVCKMKEFCGVALVAGRRLRESDTDPMLFIVLLIAVGNIKSDD
jgi:hypothetical protein